MHRIRNCDSCPYTNPTIQNSFGPPSIEPYFLIVACATSLSISKAKSRDVSYIFHQTSIFDWLTSPLLLVKIKKPNYPFPRQLGYHLRSVAFRPYFSVGLALSGIKLIEIYSFFILCYLVRRCQENNVTTTHKQASRRHYDDSVVQCNLS